jgi:uncharacterized protein CbrC (UPF0167 family)
VACGRQRGFIYTGPVYTEDSHAYVNRLTASGQPTAYLFRCLHCGAHLAFSDFT